MGTIWNRGGTAGVGRDVAAPEYLTAAPQMLGVSRACVNTITIRGAPTQATHTMSDVRNESGPPGMLRHAHPTKNDNKR